MAAFGYPAPATRGGTARTNPWDEVASHVGARPGGPVGRGGRKNPWDAPAGPGVHHTPVHGDNLNAVTRLMHRAPTRWITDAFAEPDQVTEDPYPCGGTQFLYHFRHYVDAAIQDPELLADKDGKDRRDLWDHELESWEYLGGGGHTEYIEMHGWYPVIKDLVKDDWEVLNQFRSLLQKGNRGYMEATRILAHVFKDKWNYETSQGQRNQQDPDNWSGYFKQSLSEALETIEVPDDTDELKNLRRYKGPVPDHGNWNRDRVPPPRHGGSSSHQAGYLRHGPGRRY